MWETLTPAQGTLIGAGFSAFAILVVGLLTFWSQTRQRTEAREQLDRQLTAQRDQMTTQLDQQRDQTSTELAAQRRLRLIELREETARIFRAEKKAVYVRILQITRDEQVLWQQFTSNLPDGALPDLGGR